MSVGLFTDKHHEPTDEEIIAALGSKLPLWQELIQFIRGKLPASGRFQVLLRQRLRLGTPVSNQGSAAHHVVPEKGRLHRPGHPQSCGH